MFFFTGVEEELFCLDRDEVNAQVRRKLPGQSK